MYRRIVTSLPQEPVFPHDLKQLGHVFPLLPFYAKHLLLPKLCIFFHY
jgi:hypothetical protein